MAVPWRRGQGATLLPTPPWGESLCCPSVLLLVGSWPLCARQEFEGVLLPGEMVRSLSVAQLSSQPWQPPCWWQLQGFLPSASSPSPSSSRQRCPGSAWAGVDTWHSHGCCHSSDGSASPAGVWAALLWRSLCSVPSLRCDLQHCPAPLTFARLLPNIVINKWSWEALVELQCWVLWVAELWPCAPGETQTACNPCWGVSWEMQRLSPCPPLAAELCPHS